MACRSARSDHWACFAVRAAFGVRRSSRLAIRRFRRFLASRNRFTRRACRLSWVVVFVIDAAPGGLVRSVTAPAAGPRLLAPLGSLAEIATAGAAAAMPTLITAIRGALNGPPHVVGQMS